MNFQTKWDLELKKTVKLWDALAGRTHLDDIFDGEHPGPNEAVKYRITCRIEIEQLIPDKV